MKASRINILQLEGKMLAAAGQRDYEKAIVLRDQLRAMQAELDSRAAPERPKVVDMRSRQAFEPPAEPAAPVEPKVVEPFVPIEEEVATLEYVLKSVKAGSFTGLVVLAGCRDEDRIVEIVPWSTGPVWENSQLFIGAMEAMKHDFLRIDDDLYIEVGEGDDEE